ncbi:bacterial peptide chain release factor 2 (bRF-2) [Oribacterium sp. KHPX15]|uniref:peptide chain release factor 2 n=1 Tax=unclassified Oribacterium TaxID=2629782 RepID=UPI0008968A39|nr:MULTISPECIES: peptide chain release factor 2 [unclassified Oribacterium]SEA08383.1 bacterial peptide chain release factor 2 (bRF-2) [Oribacterium sp. KHPX15]
MIVELEQYKFELNGKEQSLKDLGASLDLDNKQKRIVELDRMMEEPDFWANPETANQYSTEARRLKDDVKAYEDLTQAYEDIGALIEMAEEEDDQESVAEVKEMLDEFTEKLDAMSTRLLLSGEYDTMNAILRLNAGAGGTESNDWAGMLYRMYTRWAERHGFTYKILDYLEGDEAGIKSATIEIDGQYAYGYLRSEAGIHRLVRISPFNAQGKRQTSFVSCDIMPDIETDIDIEVRPEDIKMEVFRSSGAGGQHINKTSSAVRLIHIPTGIVVACQEERSQVQNRAKAMQMLKARLYLKEKAEQEEMIAGIRGEVKDNGWGSQIRSYVLQPYRMVKDLRSGEQSSNTDAVLDGDIDRFITAYLKWMQLGCPDRRIQGDD